MQTFKIYTLGCKVNQYESQAMREQLKNAGLRELNNGKKSDFYIINTCTVTKSADRQSRYLIRVAKRDNPSGKIVVTGCYAHSNKDDIKKMEGVNLILNNDEKQKIAAFMLPKRKNSELGLFEISDFESHTRAFVKIQDGCNNFCSFCKVPYVRGRSRSRDFENIIGEVKRLSQKGYKEIVLTGICLGDYGKDLLGSTDLVDLINEIEKIEGILRIRLSSIEARDITGKLIRKMRTSPKLCPHLHIPFQSGDDKILRLMNRRDSRASYLNLIRRLRKSITGLSITADIMIGFPGEDGSDFSNTLSFLKRARPARVHIFTFQPREGTPLSNCRSSISQLALKKRFSDLKELCDKLGFEYRKKFLQKKVKVLFEDKKRGFWRGYTNNYLLVCAKARGRRDLKDKLVEVRIEGNSATVLFSA